MYMVALRRLRTYSECMWFRWSVKNIVSKSEILNENSKFQVYFTWSLLFVLWFDLDYGFKVIIPRYWFSLGFKKLYVHFHTRTFTNPHLTQLTHAHIHSTPHQTLIALVLVTGVHICKRSIYILVYPATMIPLIMNPHRYVDLTMYFWLPNDSFVYAPEAPMFYWGAYTNIMKQVTAPPLPSPSSYLSSSTGAPTPTSWSRSRLLHYPLPSSYLSSSTGAPTPTSWSR